MRDRGRGRLSRPPRRALVGTLVVALAAGALLVASRQPSADPAPAPTASPAPRPAPATAAVAARSAEPRWALWSGGAGDASMAVVTRDRPDTYSVALDAGTLVARAPAANRGVNTRMFVWPRTAAPATDAESCAAWLAKSGANVQMGAVLRITRAGNRVRAVSLTQNIVGAQWTFNVHTWDTARDDGPYVLVDQHDMSTTFLAGGIPPSPWRLCVRVKGSTLDFKVWAGDEPDPGWGDPLRGGSTELPEGWVHEGQVGWYVGHLAPGQAAALAELSTWSLDAEPPGSRPPAVSDRRAAAALW